MRQGRTRWLEQAQGWGWLPIAAAAATGIQVGASIVATRAVVDDIDPIPLTFLRYLVGACCLVPIALRSTRVRFQPRDVPPICALGLIQFGLLIVLLNSGLQSVPAAQGSLIFALSPLIALALGVVIGQEHWSAAKAAGILLALAGLAIALGPEATRFSGDRNGAGELQILGAAASAAVAGVWSRPYLRRYGALPVSAIAMFATVAATAIPALASGMVEDITGMSLATASMVTALGIGSGIGYVLWLWALKMVSASTVTAFLTLSPVTALVAGAILLDEPLTLPTVLGVAVLCGGLWATARARS